MCTGERARKGVPPDGHLWLKYGEKNLNKSHKIRAYYKCALHRNGCKVRKFVDIDPTSAAGSSPAVSYFGNHNHEALMQGDADESKTLVRILRRLRPGGPGTLAGRTLSHVTSVPRVRKQQRAETDELLFKEKHPSSSTQAAKGFEVPGPVNGNDPRVMSASGEGFLECLANSTLRTVDTSASTKGSSSSSPVRGTSQASREEDVQVGSREDEAELLIRQIVSTLSFPGQGGGETPVFTPGQEEFQGNNEGEEMLQGTPSVMVSPGARGTRPRSPAPMCHFSKEVIEALAVCKELPDMRSTADAGMTDAGEQPPQSSGVTESGGRHAVHLATSSWWGSHDGDWEPKTAHCSDEYTYALHETSSAQGFGGLFAEDSLSLAAWGDIGEWVL